MILSVLKNKLQIHIKFLYISLNKNRVFTVFNFQRDISILSTLSAMMEKARARGRHTHVVYVADEKGKTALGYALLVLCLH